MFAISLSLQHLTGYSYFLISFPIGAASLGFSLWLTEARACLELVLVYGIGVPPIPPITAIHNGEKGEEKLREEEHRTVEPNNCNRR